MTIIDRLKNLRTLAMSAALLEVAKAALAASEKRNTILVRRIKALEEINRRQHEILSDLKAKIDARRRAEERAAPEAAARAVAAAVVGTPPKAWEVKPEAGHGAAEGMGGRDFDGPDYGTGDGSSQW